MGKAFRAIFLTTITLALPLTAGASEDDYVLSLKDHTFSPQNLVLPKNQRVKLIVHNLDKSPAEFESHDLDVEKIVPGGQSISVFVGPLEPGRYSFADEYHEDQSKAYLTVE